MKSISTSILVVLTCLMTACSTDSISNSDTTENFELDITSKPNEIELAEEILVAINEHRASINLQPLVWNNNAEMVAVDHSNYMATLNQANHDNFIDRSRFLKSQGASSVSENVAQGYSQAQNVVQAWLQSPSHKEAIEGDFTFTGIAVITSDRDIPFYTQLFGK